MKISDLLRPDGDGWWTCTEGCSYQSPTAFVCQQLGFCSCGLPVENLSYILKGLLLIRDVDFKEDYEVRKSRAISHFGNESAEYFFYYWADKEGYTEHGGSVPGWLTPEGERIVSLLEDFFESYQQEE